jgi:hypothetical protein
MTDPGLPLLIASRTEFTAVCASIRRNEIEKLRIVRKCGLVGVGLADKIGCMSLDVGGRHRHE